MMTFAYALHTKSGNISKQKRPSIKKYVQIRRKVSFHSSLMERNSTHPRLIASKAHRAIALAKAMPIFALLASKRAQNHCYLLTMYEK